jgi:hypothetical protein
MGDRFWCATSSEQTVEDAKNASKPSATINAAVLKQLAALERIHPEGQGISPFGIIVQCTKRMLVVDRRYRIDAVTLGNALDAALFKANVVLRSKDDTRKEDTEPYPRTCKSQLLAADHRWSLSLNLRRFQRILVISRTRPTARQMGTFFRTRALTQITQNHPLQSFTLLERSRANSSKAQSSQTTNRMRIS